MTQPATSLRLVMMGTGTFAEPVFAALLEAGLQVVGLVTQPDRAVGSERSTTRQGQRGMQEIARGRDIPVFQPESVNTPEGVVGLMAFRPDLLVVAAYGQILSKDVLAVAPQGGINVHASLLPKYRGAAPIAWAIYHGETQTGVTIIRMSVYLDAGDILAQEALAIGPDETAGAVEARLAPVGARLAVQIIHQIAAGTTQGTKQDKAQVTKAPKLTKEQGVIDWGRPAALVCNHVRAMQPWPTAYTYFHHAGAAPQRLIVHKAAAQDAAGQPPASPGTPAQTDGQRLLVWAGDGRLVEVRELQPAGKRRMAAADFLRGHALRPGDRFGPVEP
jgi:methionyl-tRNA formyltransferase